MARVPAWTLGTIAWGDKILQAAQFADDPNPHTNPQPSDIDINSLIADYVSKTDANSQTIASALGLGTIPSANQLCLIQDNAFGSPITVASPTILTLSPASSPQSKLGLSNQTYNYLSAAGSLDVNGQTSPNLTGLLFQPTLINSGAAVTMPNVVAIKAIPKTTSFGANTITNLIGVEVGTVHLISNPTVTSAYGVKIDAMGKSTYATIYGIDIGTLTGTTKIGIREQSTGVNLLTGKTRFGDQTTPTETLEALGNILATTNLKQSTSPGTPATVGTANAAGAGPLVPWLDHVHKADHALLDGSLINDSLAGTVARGDLIAGNATPKWARLAVGTVGQYLKTDGTDVLWKTFEQAEAASTPVAGATSTVLGVGIRVYSFFTLPTTEAFYIITGIEWKNGTVVAGNTTGGVDIVDANPPVLAPTILASLGAQVANAGVSGVQRQSRVVGSPIRGGSICGVWVYTDSATQTYGTTVVTSANNRKAITYTPAAPNADVTAWTASTVQAYVKAYYRGYGG